MSDGDERRCLEATVQGRVQGVWFRASTQERARELGLTGWVKNNPDGSVSLMAHGTASQLEQLVSFLHDGPPLAEVTGVEVQWTQPGEPLHDFVIQRGG